MSFGWYDIVGMGGTLAILLAYALLQAGRLRGDALAYQLLNLFGAAAILLTLVGRFNPAVFFLESAWVLVSAYGIVRSLRSRRASRPGR